MPGSHARLRAATRLQLRPRAPARGGSRLRARRQPGRRPVLVLTVPRCHRPSGGGLEGHRDGSSRPGDPDRGAFRADLLASTFADAAGTSSTRTGGHGYVWHCHIIDHEDNEMMRPFSVIPNADPHAFVRDLLGRHPPDPGRGPPARSSPHRAARSGARGSCRGPEYAPHRRDRARPCCSRSRSSPATGCRDPGRRPGGRGPQVLYYVDPMNPSFRSTEPGVAPCGMPLEPVYADVGHGRDDGAGGRVRAGRPPAAHRRHARGGAPRTLRHRCGCSAAWPSTSRASLA